MKYGIIAAGEGSRLLKEGINIPKPLIPINGVSMIKRLVNIFAKSGAEEIVIIINTQSRFTANYLYGLKSNTNLPIKIIEKTTESSFHSFYEVVKEMDDDRFCITTVDTIFKEDEFYSMIKSFTKGDEDGIMGVTSYIDDEKPLYISTDENMYINGFFDSMTSKTKYVSGGIYCLTSKSFSTLEKCISNNISHMRNFQRHLVEDGFRLKAYPFTKILDVDHVNDINKAEKFLKE